jgi:hypothetical protein
MRSRKKEKRQPSCRCPRILGKKEGMVKEKSLEKIKQIINETASREFRNVPP